MDYAGCPCDWKSLRFLADKYDLQLINDNCHALGATYQSNKHYAVKYADIVTHSYHPVKHFTTGEGGAILTNNSKIDEQVRCLRTHGMTKNPKLLQEKNGPWYYEMHELGFNYRITDFQCALGNSQLKKLDNFIKLRKNIAKIYDDSFEGISGLKTPSNKLDGHAYHLYPLQINFDDKLQTKNIFFEKMKMRGILLQVHYIPIHLQPFYKNNYGFNHGDFKISESFYRNEISLPIYPHLSNDDLSKIIKEIKININDKPC